MEKWHWSPLFKGVVYLPILIYLYYVIIQQRPNEIYQSAASIRAMFALGRHNVQINRTVPMDSVVTTYELYDYYMTTLVDSIFGKVENKTTKTADGSYFLIGKVRLRLQKMKRNSCKVTKEFTYNRDSWLCLHKKKRLLPFTRYISTCVARYSSSEIETGNFAEFWRSIRRQRPRRATTITTRLPITTIIPPSSDSYYPFFYRPSASIYDMTRGQYHTYPGGGHMVELGPTKDESIQTIRRLRRTRWIDNYARVVIAEFTLYNTDANLFNVVRIIAERTVTRMFVLSINDHPLKIIYSDDDTSDGKLLVALVLMIVYIIIEHILKIISRHTFKEYITSPWNWIDFVMLIWAVTTLVCLEIKKSVAKSALETFEDETTRPHSGWKFFPVARVDYLLNVFIAVLLFFATIKVWSILLCHLLYRILTINLYIILKEFLFYVLMLCAFLLLFATYATGLMSENVRPFRTFVHSILSILSLTCGMNGINFLEIDEKYGISSKLFSFFFIIIVKIYLFNLFICLVLSRYNDITVKQDIKKIKENQYMLIKLTSRISRQRKKKEEKKLLLVQDIISHKLDALYVLFESGKSDKKLK